MLIGLVIFWGIVLTQALSLFNIVRNHRYVMAQYARRRTTYRPKTVLIVRKLSSRSKNVFESR